MTMPTMTLERADLAERRCPPAEGRRLRQRLRIAILLLIAAAPYLPTLRYGFVYDDKPQIVENHDLLSLENTPRFFAQSITKAIGLHNAAQPVFYRPLFFSQLCLTRTLFGPGPFGFHLVSLLFHIGNTLLLYLTAARLGMRPAPAYLAAMLFAVHPVHVESVVWASASPELMVFGAILCALLAFLIGEASSSSRTRNRWRGFSLAAFLAALFVKETALIALPLVAAIAFFESPGKTSTRHRLATDLAPYIGIALFYFAVRTHVLHGMVATVTPASWLKMARTWPSVLWFYERHLVLPVHTSLLYDYDLVEHATLAAFWIPLAAVLATLVVTAFLLWRHRSLAVLIAALLIVLPVLLVLDFRVFYWGDLVHDRYLYIPSAGLCMLAAMALGELGRRWEKTISTSARQWLAAALLLGLALTTIAETQPWKNNLLLLANAAEVGPRNIAAQIMLGDELESRNNFVEAKICYQRALELTPAWAPAWFAYGRMLLLTHDPGGAAQSLQRAIRLDASPIAEVWFSLALERLGRHDEAQAALNAAIAQDSSMGQAYRDVQNKLMSAAGN